MRKRLSDLQTARNTGQAERTMVGRILQELHRADVAALSAARGQGWDDLLEDLLLWHVTRQVFEDILIPWLTEEEYAAALGAHGGFEDEPVPNGMIISQPGQPKR